MNPVARVLRAPYRGLLRLLPERLAARAQLLGWRAGRPLLLAVDRLRPARRRAGRVELLLLAWELDEAATREAIGRAGVAPEKLLVVTTGERFEPMRSAGCAFERLPSPSELSRHLPQLDAVGLYERRLLGIARAYPHERVAIAGDPPARLKPVLGTLAADVGELHT
jgi:hypothetical protein